MIDRWRALPPYPRTVLVRLACVPVLWFLLLTLVFVLLEVMFDPTEGLIGDFGPGDIERYRESLGLNRPVLERYWDFWQRLLTFDFGRSEVNDRPISESLRRRYSVSLELLVLTIAFSGATALTLGMLGRRHAALARVVSSLLSALPLFAVTIWALIWPLEWWGYAPPIGEHRALLDDPWGNLEQYVPPALIAGIIFGAWSSRLVVQTLRSAATVERSRVAIACGRVAADCLPLALSSLIFLEQTYTLPGLGNFLFNAVLVRDTNTIEIVLMFAFAVALLGWAVRPLSPTALTATPTTPLPRWKRRPLLLVGLALLTVVTVVAVVGPWIAEHDPHDLVGRRDENPSWNHPLGTDRLGRDVLARTLLAMRTSLTIAVAAAVLGALPGWALGFGVRGFGRAFQLLDELAASWLAVPLVPWFLLWVYALYPNGGWRIVIVPIAIYCFMVGFRLSRDSTGEGPWVDRVREPATLLTLAAACSAAAALAVTNEAIATFLGLFDHSRTSFGQEIYRARTLPFQYWSMIALTLVLTTITFTFLLIRTSLDDDVSPRTYER